MKITKRYSSRKRKQKKASREKNASDMLSIDRLSDLPDSILCHILSLLQTWVSVKTSILSRRWKYLWTHVPTLYFGYYCNSTGRRIRSAAIDAVMALHKAQTLNSFCLCLNEDSKCSQDQIETWINSALHRNAKTVDVSLGYLGEPPQSLLASKTIVDLTLRCFHWSDTMTVCLPGLRKFCIEELFYEVNDSLERMLSGCPVLEDLTVRRMSGDFGGCCSITLPTLKRLTIETQVWEHGDVPSHRLLINAPALKYLRIRDEIFEHMSAGELPSLIEVYVEFDNPEKKVDDVVYSQAVLGFLARLCNVKSLKFTLDYVDVHGSMFSSWTTKFHNLAKLELEADWRFITMFLENADNLEILIVSAFDEDTKRWAEPREVPTCLLSHLRTIKISYFESVDSEFEMVRYLLRNAKVLKRMEIRSRPLSMDVDVLENMKKEFEATKKILLFERGSEECVVAFD